MSARGAPNTPREPKKLTGAEMEKMVEHLYSDAVNHKNTELRKLERKFYLLDMKVEQKPKKSQAEIDASVERQAVKELEMRKQRQEQAAKKAAAEAKQLQQGGVEKKGALSETELEESVRRLYTDSVRIRTEQRARLENKLMFRNKSVERGKAKKLTKEELQNSARRLCVPTKREFNADEINKIWLKTETHYCEKGAQQAAGEAEEEDA